MKSNKKPAAWNLFFFRKTRVCISGLFHPNLQGQLKLKKIKLRVKSGLDSFKLNLIMEILRMENEWKLISLSFENDDEWIGKMGKDRAKTKTKLILSEEQLS
jgi:hypothetical protein